MKVRRGELGGTGAEGLDSLRPGAEVVRPGRGGQVVRRVQERVHQKMEAESERPRSTSRPPREASAASGRRRVVTRHSQLDS